MSESDTSASAIVRQTRMDYEEMRRKLAETEKKLNKLARLESKALEEDRFLPGATASLEDLESVRSELSTVPGSYTGFASQRFPASTPSKKQKDNVKPPYENYNSDAFGDSQGQTNDVKHFRQNQCLLTEVERLAGELHFAREKELELRNKLSSQHDHVMELQDRVEELQGETEALDRALRSSEEHLTESQQQMVSLQQQLLSCQQELQDLHLEVQEEHRIRCSIEKQRDEALQNFLEVQETLEKYQRHSHDKIKSLEKSEDHLRDSLAHANEERDELLLKVDSLQSALTAHEQEIERLQALSAVEQETKHDMETQALELRQHLAKLTARLQKCEKEILEISVLRQENAVLSSEVEENCEVFNQLEDLLKQLQQMRATDQHKQIPDDSGHVSFHFASASVTSGKNHSVSYSQSDTLAANTNNNGKTVEVVLNELRAMLFDMDEEIHRLRNRLLAKEEETCVIDGLKAEVSQLVKKAIHGEEQTSEMEKMIGRVEADRTWLARQLMECQEEVTKRDSQLVTLEARLSQRNAQIIELQEDLSRRCSEMTCLEKEVWKKSSHVSQMETLLEEKREEIAEYLASVTELQRKSTAQEEEVASTRQKIKTLQMELERRLAEETKSQALHMSRCQQYEDQIDVLEQDLQKRKSQYEAVNHQAHQLQQDCQEKENLIQHLEETIVETRRELETTTRRGQEVLRQLEDRLTHSSQQVTQLESALLLCRNEIQEHVQTIREMQQHFEHEVNKREQSIKHLEQQLKEAQRKASQQAEDKMHLEQELLEKNAALHHWEAHISELEQKEASLHASVSHLEQQLLQTKSRWRAESDELHHKIEAQSAELDKALSTCSGLRQTVKEIEEEDRQLSSQKSLLEKRLQEEISNSRTQVSHANRLEKNVRDLRVELEQKIEIVGQLEDQLQNKEADLQQQLHLVEELDVQQLRLQRDLKQALEKSSLLDEQVQKLQFEVKAKDQILNDTREILRKTQAELSEKTLEAKELKEAVDERQQELEGRVAMVAQLERTICETHNEMSQRMERVDSTLRKYEAEIKERTGQIADLDDKLQLAQAQQMETSLQLRQQQQVAQRQQVELQANSAKMEELEMTNQRQKQKLEEQRQENVEVTQELRLTREQLQTQHSEFLSTRRELGAVRRECERLSKELEEVMKVQRSKDQDTARLSEELGASQARTAQAEARLLAETNRLQREKQELQACHREELDALTKAHDQAQQQHASAVERTTSLSHKLTENERLYEHRLDQARSELEALQNEVTSRKELIRNANETIFMRDSEIARLKAQISRMERMLPSHAKAELASSVPVLKASYQPSSTSIASSESAFAYSKGFHNSLRQASVNQRKEHRHPLTSTSRYEGAPPALSGAHFNNNANLNSSQNASELPMKDTWADTSENEEGYLMDPMIFSFEKLDGELGKADGDLGSNSEVDSECPRQPSGSETTTIDQVQGVCEVTGGKAMLEVKQSVKVNAGAKKKPQAVLHTDRLKGKVGNKSQSLSKRTSLGKEEKGDYFHHQFEPDTLIGTYRSPETEVKSKLEVKELQQQLEANALRQQEIERQLQSLDTTRDVPNDSSTM
ncbi:coiled-coil domain-containing protein 18-like isoform X2 [Pomacea canaliculata]|uniref:coiled-coil domain-containing protein 18-like isoform X2 n=1 Tax=Pomacea canaliculata TaxID=400727 RepID=UPI000D73E242|nr:coiled-coil domain-containing protein 18-like isoform X2 [Pomacea canaliculata]